MHVLLLTLALAGHQQSFDAWQLSYAAPAGWQLGQQTGRVHGLTQGGAQGSAIYVAPGLYQSFNDVGVDLNKGFQALGLTGMPTGQPTSSTIRGMQAMTADYAGQNQMGIPLQAHAVAVITPQGTGLVVLGLAAYGQIGPVAAAVDQIAQSLQVTGPPRTNQQLMAALRGRWMFYAGKADGTTRASGGSSHSHEEFVEFDGVSRFTYQSSSSVKWSPRPGTPVTRAGRRAPATTGRTQ